MTFCDNLGLGLAMWDTSDTFNDLRSITGDNSDMFDEQAWTALNNADRKNCDGAQNCDGKLVTNKQ